MRTLPWPLDCIWLRLAYGILTSLRHIANSYMVNCARHCRPRVRVYDCHQHLKLIFFIILTSAAPSLSPMPALDLSSACRSRRHEASVHAWHCVSGPWRGPTATVWMRKARLTWPRSARASLLPIGNGYWTSRGTTWLYSPSLQDIKNGDGWCRRTTHITGLVRARSHQGCFAKPRSVWPGRVVTHFEYLRGS